MPYNPAHRGKYDKSPRLKLRTISHIEDCHQRERALSRSYHEVTDYDTDSSHFTSTTSLCPPSRHRGPLPAARSDATHLCTDNMKHSTSPSYKHQKDAIPTWTENKSKGCVSDDGWSTTSELHAKVTLSLGGGNTDTPFPNPAEALWDENTQPTWGGPEPIFDRSARASIQQTSRGGVTDQVHQSTPHGVQEKSSRTDKQTGPDVYPEPNFEESVDNDIWIPNASLSPWGVVESSRQTAIVEAVRDHQYQRDTSLNMRGEEQRVCQRCALVRG